MNSVSENLLALHNTSKSLGGVRLFTGLDFSIGPRESVAILGESGSGKSTLLHLMAGLERPDQGEVLWLGQNLQTMSDDVLAMRRLHNIGLVFQAYYLMPHLNAQQNVELPLLLAGQKVDHGWAAHLLEQVGLPDKGHRKPGELSGGEQQRVAIARALVMKPPIVLADEPTGNLDEKNAEIALEVLLESCQQARAALVLVTHSQHIALQLDQQLNLAHGSLT
ncbi:ABC transporter ATP-binding protein [Limnobacter litoralis]|uniref:Lipoprotein-releasing system ATP-binding protein LolD n=1 Tax=Limnobacter litoralis TaxID=481366 RepID=A0ABQ5YMF8_9BURK|nr:ABC transporter ATP-binding protein [Limnobacter litoralis]GLR25778.1 lipoprotein-releasing system ATP-binding protein LolD [Limnobacter litoralis]